MTTKRRMSRILSLLLVLALVVSLVPTTAFAVIASGQCGDNAWWELDASGTLSITGSGAMYDYVYLSWDSAPWSQYWESITEVIIHSEITSIGNCAFYGCKNLTSVTIPESVISIGHRVFYHCSSLTGITIPEGVSVIGDFLFSNCSSLKSVVIPESVTHIGDWAFDLCTSLTDVTIPEGVTSIGNGIFSDCIGLTDVTIPESVTSMGSHVFQNCSNLTSVTMLGGGSCIGQYTFYQCSSLTSVTLPEGLTAILEKAFSGCGSLSGITVPDSVVNIASGAFTDCHSLTGIIIPEGVTRINKNAFQNCDSLTSVTIPKSVTNINDYAFEGCSNLKDVYISDLSAWCQIYYDNAIGNPMYLAENLYLNNELLTVAVIPDHVTRIGRYAFYNCDSLEAVVFMGSAPTFGSDCFAGVNATVYHSCADASWTSQIKKDYGGSLTWIGHLLENGTCTVCGYVEGVTLSGSITSFAQGAVTLTLTGDGIEETITADSSFCLTAAPGEYILTVAKENHVTRQYAVILESGDVVLDVKINLIGDIDGNGRITVGDVAKLNAHLKGTNKLTDAYELLCANVNGGSLNMGDTAALYGHIKGTKKLY